MAVVERLEIAGMLLVFLKDTCRSRLLIQTLTAHHIDEPRLKRCDDAHVKNVTPVCQMSLGAATNNHHLSRGDSAFNDLAASFVEGTRIYCQRYVDRDRHCWMNQS